MNRLLLLFFACMMISSQSVYAQCSGSSLTSASLDFSSGGPFSFTDIGGGDITNGGSRTAGPFSFDIWDETTGTATPGGANDITFDFSMTSTFDPYGGAIEETTSGTHEIDQSTSGIRGTLTMGTSGATDATTGDVRCYSVTVSFASHIEILASDFNVDLTSVNTRGEVFESSSLVFLDGTGSPYGTATYDGFYSSPPTGVPGGSNPPTVSSNPWSTTGTGVYLAESTGTVDLTDIFNPVALGNGPNDNFDPNAATDGSLGLALVGGFVYTVCLEDIAATAADGDITTSGTSFTSTLNGLDLSSVCFGNITLPVELSSFTVQENDGNALLEWVTESEENSSYFEIEHSTDGRTFERIGSEKAAINSAERVFYKFNHTNPIFGENYYRLKQVDLDNTFSYSDVKKLRLRKGKELILYPNLSHSSIKVVLSGSSLLESHFRVMDLSGRMWSSGILSEGENNYELDVSKLPKGQYLFMLQNAEGVLTNRFIKL